ncbi:hypothetical protein ACO1O0_003050 [Amphichorda felina]
MALSSLWRRATGGAGVAKAVSFNLVGLATWIPVIAWFNLYVAELTYVDGASMYPLMNSDKNSTLRQDVVLTWKWMPQQQLERGMVVTLRSPNHPEVVAVKRVVALEGDIIRTKPPYLEPTVWVPYGHVWVEGDGPPGSSLDSNTYGPVSKRLITGKVTHIIYPFNKLGPINWRDHERQLVE